MRPGRRIERDLHDGTQQRLVSLGLELRLAQSMVPTELPELGTKIGWVADELNGVVGSARACPGIHPAILSEGGPRLALRTLARRAAIPVDLDVAAIGLLPEPVEMAAYFVVSDALTNATKDAHGSVGEVDMAVSGGTLRVRVRDDGVGGANPLRGAGLVGLMTGSRRWAALSPCTARRAAARRCPASSRDECARCRLDTAA